MRPRLIRIAAVVALVLLAMTGLRPYLEHALYAATAPRAIEVRGHLSELEQSIVQLFEKASPSVVQVTTDASGTETPSLEVADHETQSPTGFVWDTAGNIVTNDHVVQGTKSITIRFSHGEVAKAKIVGLAPNYDLAVIRVQGVNLPPPIAIGTSADLKVGQFAYAIGNPFGLDLTLTTGVVSALKRRLPTSGGREIADVIQTDAAINPGNSGGPLLDSAGRLIGVNTAMVSSSGANAGIGFAIPVDVVNRIVPQLIDTGRVPTPGIGIVAGSEAIATRLGVEGIVVVRVVAGSPAERAGLRGVDKRRDEPGDVIVAVNGKPAHRLADLTSELERVGIGGKLELTVKRGGRKLSLTVEVVDVSRAS
jgi:2-alkenal reductase